MATLQGAGFSDTQRVPSERIPTTLEGREAASTQFEPETRRFAPRTHTHRSEQSRRLGKSMVRIKLRVIDPKGPIREKCDKRAPAIMSTQGWWLRCA